MDASVTQLADYIDQVTHTFNLAGRRAMTALRGYQLPAAERCPSLDDLKGWLGQQLPE
jgi:hypothetical protein